MSNPIRVISIAHDLHRIGTGRLRYKSLAQDPNIELLLVGPSTWDEDGKRTFADPVDLPINLRIEKIWFESYPGVKWYLHVYPNLKEIIKEYRPDVIHLWEEPWALVSLQAMWLRDRYAPQAALILETTQNVTRHLPPPFEWIRRTTLKKIDWLLSRSNEATEVSRACGYTGGATIVHYCYDKSRFYKSNASTSENAEIGTIKIGYVGRITRDKGLFEILEAMRQASTKVIFELMGDGYDKDNLMERAKELGLEERVRFLAPGRGEQVAEFMRSIDVLILMSKTTRTWKEKFGRVIIEAHACGVPVIGSDSGSIPSVIGEGGWVVHEDDSSALAELLDHLANHREEIEAARAKSLLNVERFSEQEIAKNLLIAWISALNVKRHENDLSQGTLCRD